MGRMKMFAPIVPLTLVAAALLVCASTSVAAPRVIGGTTTQIRSAPWAVFVRQAASPGSLVCSGSIIDSFHVLTAAHCVYDRNGALASVSSLSIRAGISNYVTPLPDDAEQGRSVSSMRVHPGYRGPGNVGPYDVAVLALSDPLDLSGSAVGAVQLPAPGAQYPAGAEVGVAGFGRDSAAASQDGPLRWFTAAVEGQGRCGGFSNPVVPDYDAVALCAGSPTAAVCTGDSGGGLVTTGATQTIVGVVSAGGTSCAIGAGIYTYLGAPEVLRFIQGDDHPPAAPHGTASTSVTLSWVGKERVGNTLTCESGGWDGAPTISYAFLNALNGQVLQQTANATYRLSAADAGARVYCQVMAANDGGTAVLETTSTREVGPPPRLGIGRVAPVSAVQGRTVAARVVLYVPSGVSGKFGVCITPPAKVAIRTCSSFRIEDGSYGSFPFTLRLRIKPTAPLGASRLAISAVAGIASGDATALVSVARGTGG